MCYKLNKIRIVFFNEERTCTEFGINLCKDEILSSWQKLTNHRKPSIYLVLGWITKDSQEILKKHGNLEKHGNFVYPKTTESHLIAERNAVYLESRYVSL